MVPREFADVLAKGLRTADIVGESKKTLSTAQMGDVILAEPQAGLR
jgi:hypothetical protein